MHIRTLRLFPLFAWLAACATACTPTPKISARLMEKQLSTTIYNFNKAINDGSYERAIPFVAPAAKVKFDRLVEGFKQKRYNAVMSMDLPAIDYMEAKASVIMIFLLGEYSTQTTQKTYAQEIERQSHLWKFENGAWQWHGPTR